MTGDGAASVLIGPGDPIAILCGSATQTVDFVDHFREIGRNGDYSWEERWIREEGYLKLIPEVAQRALQQAQMRAEDVDVFLMPAPLLRVNQTVAKKIGIRPTAIADPLFETIGDTGTAHPLLLLAHQLEHATAGQKLMLVQFASGCDVIVLEVLRPQASRSGAPLLSSGQTETNYLKYLSFTGQVKLDWGMRAEMDTKTALSAAWRANELTMGFSAGHCSSCGTIQFPLSRICVNPKCNLINSQKSHRLADDLARVRSFTCDWLTFKPSPPFLFGHVEFEHGARAMMEFTDCEPDELAVGVPLKMLFRIKDVDPNRGFRRYFWKATILRQDQDRKNG
jgi:uncharacterized OB-fold protein